MSADSAQAELDNAIEVGRSLAREYVPKIQAFWDSYIEKAVGRCVRNAHDHIVRMSPEEVSALKREVNEKTDEISARASDAILAVFEKQLAAAAKTRAYPGTTWQTSADEVLSLLQTWQQEVRAVFRNSGVNITGWPYTELSLSGDTRVPAGIREKLQRWGTHLDVVAKFYSRWEKQHITESEAAAKDAWDNA